MGRWQHPTVVAKGDPSASYGQRRALTYRSNASRTTSEMLSSRSSAFALACSQSASGTRTERMTIGIFATRGSVLGVLTLGPRRRLPTLPRSVTEPNRRDGSEWPAPSGGDRQRRTSRRQSEPGHDYARVPRQCPSRLIATTGCRHPSRPPEHDPRRRSTRLEDRAVDTTPLPVWSPGVHVHPCNHSCISYIRLSIRVYVRYSWRGRPEASPCSPTRARFTRPRGAGSPHRSTCGVDLARRSWPRRP